VDYKLELIVVPSVDLDRAKEFYTRAGFALDVDHSAGDFRVVQLTPPGSACSIALMRSERAGSLSGLHLIVPDIELARAELGERGVEVTGPYHFDQGAQRDGPDPGRADYSSFLAFSDPDGNGWLLQEVGHIAAGS
jgi:hypothetical protein